MLRMSDDAVDVVIDDVKMLDCRLDGRLDCRSRKGNDVEDEAFNNVELLDLSKRFNLANDLSDDNDTNDDTFTILINANNVTSMIYSGEKKCPSEK
jgi:hypothetical protein